MKVRKVFVQVGVLALVALSVGCASQRTWVYRANSYPPPHTVIAKKVVVQPFSDDRVNKNSNMLGMYAIPLMPFGWQTFHAPEGAEMHTNTAMWINYKPTEDFPKALATDLSAMGIFKEAYFGYRKGDADYVIKGRILSTDYNGKIISYGLSIYGPLLWIVGFPSTYVTNDLSLELELDDAVSHKTILDRQYKAEPYSKLSWLYVIRSDFDYAQLLAQIYKRFDSDVQAALIKKP